MNTYLKKAIELINNHEELAHFIGGGKADILINKAEQKLNLKFPKSYRDFLTRLGELSFGGDEFLGIADENCWDYAENGSNLDAIGNTLWLWNSYQLPRNLFIIYHLGEGTSYAIDMSRCDENGESPVVVVPIGYKGGFEPEVISNSFGEFLYNTIRSAISRREKRSSENK